MIHSKRVTMSPKDVCETFVVDVITETWPSSKKLSVPEKVSEMVITLQEKTRADGFTPSTGHKMVREGENCPQVYTSWWLRESRQVLQSP